MTARTDELGASSVRLVFEKLAARHAAELSDALTDPRVYEFHTGRRPETPDDLHAQFVRLSAGPPAELTHETWWNFVVRLREGPALGTIQATLHDAVAEVGYRFGPSFWGNGYATESLQWLHDRIRAAGFATAWAAVSPQNAPSIRLLQRVGYQEVRDDRPPLVSYDPGDLVYRAQLIAPAAIGLG